nr:uncharacterized protein LOC115264316 [Aedes albopictus]
MSSTERRIKGLKTRLKSLLTSFNLIKTFVEEYQEDRDSRQVSVRLEHLLTLWRDVNATQAELETLDDEGLDQYLKVRTDFETSYFHVKGFLLSVNKSAEPASPSASRSPAQNPPTSSSRRVTVLQTINKPIEVLSQSAPKKPAPRSVASHGASQPNYRKCLVCSDHHPLYLCAVFSKMTIEDKEKDVRRHQLCRNCLRKGHQARECPSSSTCRKCRSRHHTLLCPGEALPVSANSRTSEAVPPKAPSVPVLQEQPRNSASAVSPPVSCASSGLKPKSVLLATAVVILVDDSGVEHAARALLDSGSECCFMTESLAQQIKAKRTKINVPITGIGQSSTHARHKLQSTIRSRVSGYSTAIEFLFPVGFNSVSRNQTLSTPSSDGLYLEEFPTADRHLSRPTSLQSPISIASWRSSGQSKKPTSLPTTPSKKPLTFSQHSVTIADLLSAVFISSKIVCHATRN